MSTSVLADMILGELGDELASYVTFTPTPTPAGRIYRVPAENRTYRVPAENRVMVVT